MNRARPAAPPTRLRETLVTWSIWIGAIAMLAIGLLGFVTGG